MRLQGVGALMQFGIPGPFEVSVILTCYMLILSLSLSELLVRKSWAEERWSRILVSVAGFLGWGVGCRPILIHYWTIRIHIWTILIRGNIRFRVPVIRLTWRGLPHGLVKDFGLSTQTIGSHHDLEVDKDGHLLRPLSQQSVQALGSDSHDNRIVGFCVEMYPLHRCISCNLNLL